mgnify:CR=1 FL=1
MLVILRHAEPRRGESDPELTSAGHRMALEAGEWVLARLPGAAPVRILHTPTARTRQTALGVRHWLADRASLNTIEALPETLDDLEILADRICGARPGLPSPPLPPTVLVGHHTTLVALARELRPSPAGLNPRHYSAGLAIERKRGTLTGWAVVSVWPGRPG